MDGDCILLAAQVKTMESSLTLLFLSYTIFNPSTNHDGSTLKRYPEFDCVLPIPLLPPGDKPPAHLSLTTARTF